MAPSSRLPLVMGNWKMHRGGPDGADLARAVLAALGGRAPAGVEVVLLPPPTAIAPVADAIRGTGVRLGGQSCHAAEKGAFTGETAAPFLAALGCGFVLCGHSERRRLSGEDDAAVAARVRAALAAGLRPVLCVGETLEERDAGATEAVISRQVAAGTAGLDAAAAARLEVAYEPVWAIGTGLTPMPSDIAEMHAYLRKRLSDALPKDDEGERVRLLYGGSANAGNAVELLATPGVDGLLVGGASLDAEAFWKMVQAAV